MCHNIYQVQEQLAQQHEPLGGYNMQIIGAVILTLTAALAATAGIALAECDCTVTFGPPIVFTEDPLVFAAEDVNYHAIVEEVYFDAGECVVFINYPDGLTSTYTEAAGYEVHKLTLAAHVAAHPAFLGKPSELTLSEVAGAAADVCSLSEAPNS
jgi:hypothetical protein